jgi:hypothetical protein
MAFGRTGGVQEYPREAALFPPFSRQGRGVETGNPDPFPFFPVQVGVQDPDEAAPPVLGKFIGQEGQPRSHDGGDYQAFAPRGGAGVQKGSLRREAEGQSRQYRGIIQEVGGPETRTVGNRCGTFQKALTQIFPPLPVEVLVISVKGFLAG